MGVSDSALSFNDSFQQYSKARTTASVGFGIVFGVPVFLDVQDSILHDFQPVLEQRNTAIHNLQARKFCDPGLTLSDDRKSKFRRETFNVYNINPAWSAQPASAVRITTSQAGVFQNTSRVNAASAKPKSAGERIALVQTGS